MMWESLLFITVFYWWIDTFDLCIDLCFCSSSWLDVCRVRYCRTTLLPCGCCLPLTNSLCTSLRSARSLTSSVQLVLFVWCVSLIHVFWVSGFNPFQSWVAIGRQGLPAVKEGLAWIFALGCSVVVLFISLSLGLGILHSDRFQFLPLCCWCINCHFFRFMVLWDLHEQIYKRLSSSNNFCHIKTIYSHIQVYI